MSQEEVVAWITGQTTAVPQGFSPNRAAQADGSGRVVDFRSDTVTQPTAAMRLAMATAVVGDDVLGHDPTTEQLEKELARLGGKEAGLFVPSGTMSNLIAVCMHCDRRDSEAILGADSHMFLYEQGGLSTVGGIHPRTVPNQADGTLLLDDIRAAIRSENDHFPVSRVVILENTQNAKGGRVLSLEYMDAVGQLCKEKGLALHLDGARIFNALAVLQTDLARALQPFDSVSICLSKGLGAPCGSVLLGRADFILRARRWRKVLGGGMRQSGILAAAGLVGLQTAPQLLPMDHARAQQLAQGLAALDDGIKINLAAVETNILFANVADLCARLGFARGAAELVAALEARGVRAVATGPATVRLCTHHHITDDDVRFTLEAFRAVVATERGV